MAGGQVATKEFRASTSYSYRHALRLGCFEHRLAEQRRLGDVSVDAVTREQLGAVLQG